MSNCRHGHNSELPTIRALRKLIPASVEPLSSSFTSIKRLPHTLQLSRQISWNIMSAIPPFPTVNPMDLALSQPLEATLSAVDHINFNSMPEIADTAMEDTSPMAPPPIHPCAGDPLQLLPRATRMGYMSNKMCPPNF